MISVAFSNLDDDSVTPSCQCPRPQGCPCPQHPSSHSSVCCPCSPGCPSWLLSPSPSLPHPTASHTPHHRSSSGRDTSPVPTAGAGPSRHTAHLQDGTRAEHTTPSEPAFLLPRVPQYFKNRRSSPELCMQRCPPCHGSARSLLHTPPSRCPPHCFASARALRRSLLHSITHRGSDGKQAIQYRAGYRGLPSPLPPRKSTAGGETHG